MHSQSVRWAAACVGLALCACSEGDLAGPALEPARPTSIVSLTGDFTAVSGYRKHMRFKVVDAAGRGVGGVGVRFEPGDGGISGPLEVDTDATGLAVARWEMPSPHTGTVWLRASAVSHDGAELETPLEATVEGELESFSLLLDEMLIALEFYISLWLRDLSENLPRNPHLETQIREKMALLNRPDLDLEIFADRRFHEHPVPSMSGRVLPVGIVFATETVRTGAERIGPTVEDALPILESFFDEPFPAFGIKVWYGFRLGASGGGGTLSLEDRETYEARSGPLPYNAIVYHEMGHSYMGNESLTQLIEMIAFNVLHTGSVELSGWSYLRGYPGPRESNVDLYAALDIYGMIGYDAVARAYRAIYPIGSPYGQPLCDACVQAFVNEAPDDLKAAVEAKARAIRF